ncbi:hypothetical protein HNR61_006127 [Actinomadura namibiensis]|uniref:Glycosyltransferase RgtA/B/C/D-like domain-containing protein n=1 Tax=Actinomadura namibiensis TaxID=182080 RepID=A0A7W3LUD6_ACTNM|nr:hypothetical protein [Actinomadura namibiensis]
MASPVRLARRAAREHWPALAAFTVAAAIRAVAVLGYPTILWFGDTVGYLRTATTLFPSGTRPSGYSLLLLALRPLHSFVAVVTVQHVIGLLTAALLYAVVWRHARRARPARRLAPSALGTLVAAPVLFDGYQIELEHLGLSDSLFTFLVVAAAAILLWNPGVTWRTAAAAGLLLGGAAVTRAVGLPLLLIVLAWLLLRRRGRRAAMPPAAALTAAFLVPVLLYMSWFAVAHERFALTTTDRVFLYGRTTDFADCSIIRPRPGLARLCPKPPPKDVSPAYAALWTEQSPFLGIPGGKGGGNDLAGEFAMAAIRAQPGDYARVVARDTFRAFEWERRVYPSPWTFRKYEFPARSEKLTARQAKVARAYARAAGPRPVNEPYAGWMRAYQDHVHLPGTVLGVLLLAAVAGAVARRRPERVALPWLLSLGLLVVPAATADFDYRYVLPAAPLGALAAALAFVPGRRDAATAPRDEGRDRAAGEPPAAPVPASTMVSDGGAAPGTGPPAEAPPARPRRERPAWRARGRRTPADRSRRPAAGPG